MPVTVAGGMGNSDRIEIWRDGALYSWDQSIYLQEFFDNDYGPAKPLLAPAEPGEYELVYVFSGLDGDAAVAARQPLSVGAVPDLDEAGLPPEASRDTQIAAADAAEDAPAMGDVGYACPADNGVPCFFDDPQTGLVFALPPGWITDLPTREAATAGGQPGPIRVSFFSTREPVETVTLNPHQWTTMNGPCIDIQPGALCRFESDSAEMARAMEVLSRGIRDMGPRDAARAGESVAGADGHGEDAGATRAWSDYPYRCLPGDKTQPICEMRDDQTGLTFILPENWVADVVADDGALRADFFEVTGDARSAHLNPVAWPTPDSGCFATRAGPLCTDMALADDTLSEALRTLRRYMTTGEVLRNCGTETCTFEFPPQDFSGTLPPRFGVEVGRYRLDGRLASWFYGTTPDLELTLIGLNQPGGENCRDIAPGVSLCEHTPHVAAADFDLIADGLNLPSFSDAPPLALVPLDPATAADLAELLGKN